MPFDEGADLRTTNASVPVIANHSPIFAGIVVVSMAQHDRSRSDRSYPLLSHRREDRIIDSMVAEIEMKPMDGRFRSILARYVMPGIPGGQDI